ncbi:MAG: tetratricopeptide repeat protein, partial [Cyclobacteriaceae bacterium]|nr:tetratricopeptide repeat protein [Cyclobacteriaceae bacterium HetDA_MAG_MS6]
MERVFTLVWILLTTYPALCTDVSTIDDLHGQIGSMLSNEPEKAMALAQQALDLSRQKHYTYGEGISLFFLGYLYDASGHKSKSLLSFLRSKKALSGSSDERALKQWLTVTANIGKLLHDHGKYQEAIDFYQEGIAVASQKGYQRRAAIFHYRQGNAERKLGYLDESITTLRIALKIFKEIRDEKWILNSYNILGLTLKDWQEYDRARAYHHQVLNFRYDKVDANYYLGRAYQNLADTYLEEKRFQEALQVLNKALAYKELG